MLADFVGRPFSISRPTLIVNQNVYRNFDFKRAIALVDAALALPPGGEK
jgi:hypothetical protein